MLKEIARYEDADLRNTKWSCISSLKNDRGWLEQCYKDSKGNIYVVESEFYDHETNGFPDIRNQILYQEVEEKEIEEVKVNDKLIGGNEMNVYMKLINVQNELKAPKSQYNSFGKYNYRSCEDILEAVKPICKKYKAVVFVRDEIVMIGDRYYIKAISTFVDCESGEKVEADALARESLTKKGMDDSQVTGSTSSYARKYSLNGLFCIDDTKDSDFTNTHGKDKDSSTSNSNYDAGKITTQMLIALAKRKGYSEEKLKERYGVSDVKYIKQEDKKKAYEGFAGLPDKK